MRPIKYQYWGLKMILLNNKKSDCGDNRCCGKGIYDLRKKRGFNKRILQKNAPNRYSKTGGETVAETKSER